MIVSKKLREGRVLLDELHFVGAFCAHAASLPIWGIIKW